MEFSYDIKKDFGVFDERNNSLLSMRIVQWGENTPKLELRKWTIDKDGREIPNKGFSFLTEDGPDNLINMMVKSGYGNTNNIVSSLIDRGKDEFIEAIKNYGKEDLMEISDDMYSIIEKEVI